MHNEKKRELCIAELEDVLKRIKNEQQTRRLEKSGFTNFEDEFACMVEANQVRYLLVDSDLRIRKANRAAIDSSPNKIADIAGSDLIDFIRTTVVGEDQDVRKLDNLKRIILGVISDDTLPIEDCNSVPSLLVVSSDRRLFVINAVPISIDDRIHVIVAIDDQTDNQRAAEFAVPNRQHSSLWALVRTISRENTAFIDIVRKQIELARNKLPKDSDALSNLDTIDQAIVKLADLENLISALGNRCCSTEMRCFDKEPAVAPIDLVERAISRSLVNALYDAPTSFPNIILKPTGEKLPLIAGDDQELGTCLDALLDNSIDATSQGTIYVTISLEHVTSDPSLQSGDYLRISITDEGQGVPYQNLESVFEPLFTTKPSGRGMGLPLASSIAKHHGGAVKLVAVAERGTRACLYLPIRRMKE